jgi:hypothetical protein
MAQGTWNTFGFDHTQTITYIDGITDQKRRADEIIDILSTYQRVSKRWRTMLRDASVGLEKDRTDEYVEILGCAPHFDTVVSASYQLLSVWPEHTVPLLETIHWIIGIEAETTQLFRIQNWDSLSQRFYFDFRRIRTELDRIEEIDTKIEAYEKVREKVIQHGRSGTLIIIDPKTGKWRQPEEEEPYDRLVENLFTEEIDPMLFKLRTIPFVAARKRKTRPKHDPHNNGAIKWRGSLPGLVTLLEELLSRGLITARYDQLPHFLLNHFCDKWEFSFRLEDALPYFSRTPAIGAQKARPTEPITWACGQVPLLELITQLIGRDFISHGEDRYGDVITNHFVDKSGAPFKEGSLRTTKTKVRDLWREAPRDDRGNPETPETLRQIDRLLGVVLGMERKYR